MSDFRAGTYEGRIHADAKAADAKAADAKAADAKAADAKAADAKAAAPEVGEAVAIFWQKPKCPQT